MTPFGAQALLSQGCFTAAPFFAYLGEFESPDLPLIDRFDHCEKVAFVHLQSLLRIGGLWHTLAVEHTITISKEVCSKPLKLGDLNDH